jgi:hypothetical protein
MSNNPLELAEVIQALRENLTAAQSQGEGQNIRFNVTNVDVELQTVIEKEAGAGAKVKFLVVEADANGKYKNAITHKIKLSLQAVDMTKTNPVTGELGGTVELSNLVTR